jgi:hypothetical protein
MSTKMKNGLINPKREPLTPEKPRELSGLDLSDEQEVEVIWSLTRYAQILYDFAVQQEQTTKHKNDLEASE